MFLASDPQISQFVGRIQITDDRFRSLRELRDENGILKKWSSFLESKQNKIQLFEIIKLKQDRLRTEDGYQQAIIHSQEPNCLL